MNWPLRLAQSVIPPGLHWFLGLKHSQVHGRARWMNAREEHAFLAAGHPGLACGPGRRLSADESFKNLILMAPTGSGKTTRYVIPNLLQLQGSAVVTDPSGEIYRATSGHLARQGYSVQVLQPAAPEQSLKFNPLACFGTPQELRRLATVLCETSAGSDRFWTIGAVNILTLCLRVLTALGDPRYANLANARWLLNHIGTNAEGARRYFAQFLDEVGFADFAAFLAQDPKVTASILSSARPALLSMPPYYALPALREQSERPPFPLPQTREQPVAYLPLSDPQPADIEASLATLFAGSPAAWAAAE